MALNVLFLYPPPPRLQEYLAGELHGAAVELHFADQDHALDDPALLALAAEADVVIGSRPTAQFLARCRRARLFQLPWAGVTPLLPALRESNALRTAQGLAPLQLANNHGVCPATAQHAVAMLLALANRLLPHDTWMRAGRWRTGDGEARSIPLRGDITLGLLGYGAINQRVHALLEPFGMQVVALKQTWREVGNAGKNPSLLDKYLPDELPDFLRASDILVIAVPLTPLTDGMLGAAELALLGARGRSKRSQPDGGLPLLVNVARGPVLDEAALYSALHDRMLAGAALDVWYDYQPEPDSTGRRFPWHNPAAHPFHELPNVLLSPHRAASPLDDLERWGPVVDNLRRMAQGAMPHSVVDLAAGY